MANVERDHAARIEAIERRLAPLVAPGEAVLDSARTPLVDRMAEAGTPGVGIAVIDDGRIAWERGYGVLEAGQPAPVTPATLFQCASISKPIAAVTALRLVEAGALTLDGDVNDLLTSWRIPPVIGWGERGRVEAQPRITLRQLLSHTAGLTVHGFPGYAVGATLPSLLDILDGAPTANTPPIRVDTLPGAQMRYSGGGYVVLAQLLEDVTGTPFAALARELTLEPLGMLSSNFEQPLTPARAPLAARAHRAQAEPVPGGWHVYPELAPDGLWAPPGDLARFALGLQAALREEPGAILSPAKMREMMTPQAPEADVESVGLGIFLDGAGEKARFGHTGGNAGFGCELTAYQWRGQGAVVMTNSDTGWLIYKALLNTMAEVYAWPDYTPFALSGDWRFWAGPVKTLLALLCGVYVDDNGRRCVISQKDSELWLALGDQPPLLLSAESATDWEIEGAHARVSFTLGDDGAATSLTLRQNQRALTMRRSEA